MAAHAWFSAHATVYHRLCHDHHATETSSCTFAICLPKCAEHNRKYCHTNVKTPCMTRLQIDASLTTDEYTADMETRSSRYLDICDRPTEHYLLVVIFHPQPLPGKGDCQVIHCKSLPALPGCQQGLFHVVTWRMSAPELALLQEEDASNIMLVQKEHASNITLQAACNADTHQDAFT